MIHLLTKYRKWQFKRLKENESGVAATEFALSLPLLLILLSGIVEVGNFLLLNVKAQHSVVALGDLVTRGQTIEANTVADVYESVEEIMSPFPADTEALMIITAISLDTGGNPNMPDVIWQCTSPGSGVTGASEFGTITAPVNPMSLPTTDFSAEEITMRAGETVVVTEFFYQYEPLVFMNVIEPQIISRKAYFRPRIGSLVRVQDVPLNAPDPASGCVSQP
jgi:Flp pilus assembly pilin Flp